MAEDKPAETTPIDPDRIGEIEEESEPAPAKRKAPDEHPGGTDRR